MFRPVPMVLINLQVEEEDIARATAVLTKLRIMHLINLVETPLGKLGYMGHLERDLLARYERAGEEVDRWAQALGLAPQVVNVPADLDPAKDIYRLEDSLQRIRQSVGPAVQRLQEGKDRLDILQRHHGGAHRAGEAGDFVGGLPFETQCDQPRRNLRRGGVAAHDHTHRLFGSSGTILDGT